MNRINKLFLYLILLPRKLYALWDIDIAQLKSILTYKLMMDDRRPNTFQATRANTNSEKEISNATIWTMLSSFFMGLMFLLVFFVGNDYITHLTLYFSMFIVFLSMTLVGDFTGVLIDIRDTYIILPKPVNDQTVVMARLMHIFVHLSKLVVPMTFSGFLYLSINVGIGKGLVFLIAVIFAILLSIFLINAVYIVILRFTTPARFKNVISYIQIAFTILIFGTYQSMTRFSDGFDYQTIDLSANDWLLFAPPYWFACLFHVLTSFEASLVQYLAAIFGLLFPIASIFVVIKYLAPSFNRKLAMISGSGDNAAATKSTLTVQEKPAFSSLISTFFTNNKQEKTGFLFAWKMMLRSREFKVKVYPTIGYFIVLAALNTFKNGAGSIHLSNSFQPLMIIYLCFFILIIAIANIAYSERYHAAWMFLVTPIARPGEILSGAVKAVVFQFTFILFLASLILGIVLGDLTLLANLMLALCNLLLISFGMAAILVRQLPFSQPPGNMEKGGQTIRSMMMMFLSGFIGLLHYFIFKHITGILIAIVVSAIFVKILIEIIRKKRWTDIRVQE